MKHLLLASSLCAVAACGADPVTVSQPVGITFKTRSNDVFNSAINRDKNINTEMGNPYGAFITASKEKLGDDLVPNQIVVESLELSLGATSTNVVAIEEVFAGQLAVVFVLDDSNNTYDVGRVTDPTGATVPLEVLFDAYTVLDADAAKFLGGGFKVELRGVAAAGFTGRNADADLQLTFGFAAFE